MREAFTRAGILKLMDIIALNGCDLADTAGLAAGQGGKTERIVCKLLDHWTGCLMGHEHLLLRDYSGGVTVP